VSQKFTKVSRLTVCELGESVLYCNSVSEDYNDSTMTTLELKNLAKKFADVTAVKSLGMYVQPGSLVALLGPSGCGKTTTLRLIAGLEEPSSGDILFNGTSVLGVPTHKRNIGMVFQRYLLFPHMDVQKNVSFGLRMRGLHKTEVARRVAEVLEVVQLTGLERRFPSQLSGGQQQRVAIARTVVTNPKILLMDEPFSNLDAKLREEMRAFIAGLQKQLGITTVFVTHDQTEALELADTIALMMDGSLEQVGTPETIFNRPKSARVAEFMGTTNLLTGKLIAKGVCESVLETSFKTFHIGHATSQGIGTTVTATIRPEHIEFTDDYSGENSFVATIRDVVYHGGMVGYKVQVGETSLHLKDRSTRRFVVGEEVNLKLPEEHVWIFPEQ
jgi:putative spermidine/putrescine transport system ATP-binding protein